MYNGHTFSWIASYYIHYLKTLQLITNSYSNIEYCPYLVKMIWIQTLKWVDFLITSISIYNLRERNGCREQIREVLCHCFKVLVVFSTQKDETNIHPRYVKCGVKIWTSIFFFLMYNVSRWICRNRLIMIHVIMIEGDNLLLT